MHFRLLLLLFFLTDQLAIFTQESGGSLSVERTVTVYHKKDPVLVEECFTADNCSSQQSTLLLSSLTFTNF